MPNLDSKWDISYDKAKNKSKKDNVLTVSVLVLSYNRMS